MNTQIRTWTDKSNQNSFMKVHLIEKRIALAGTDTLSLGSVSNRRIVIVFGAIDYNTNIQEKSFMILGVRISEE